MAEQNVEPAAASEPSKKINVINKETVHQICSGQVVLDLAVAVKELVENSLDSGATYIDVKLIDYGQTCITVSDNGSGVVEADFKGLGLKHHTSKIRDFSDIFEISTFGFRGEALSSLCSLSDLSVITKHSTSPHAFKLQFDKNGILKKKEICAREGGTTVSVKNIFKSLPVRAKEFQKNIKKEFTKALQILYGYCLVAKGVKITCSNSKEGKPAHILVTTTGTGGVLDNALAVFGKKALKGIDVVELILPDETLLQEFGLSSNVDINFTWEFYTSSCQHTMGCAAANRQFFYINGRPCTPAKINKLINNLYHKYNNKQYPFIYLNLKLEQSSADVNVTPDKRTIFLTHEKFIMACIKMSLQQKWDKMQGSFISSSLEQLQNSLKRSLSCSNRDHPPLKKKMIFSPPKVSSKNNTNTNSAECVSNEIKEKNDQESVCSETKEDDVGEVVLEKKLPDADMQISIKSIRAAVDLKQKSMKQDNSGDMRIKYTAEIDVTKNADAEKELQRELTKDSFMEMEIIGQFNLGFIVTKLNGDLFIIDQHATDEKYRFEKLSNETKLKTQKLIAPKSLNFSALNETIVMEHQSFFDANGFTFSIIPNAEPGHRVLLTGMPVSGNWQFGEEDLEELIFLIREDGVENTNMQKIVRPSRVRSMLASKACRGAVMIGKVLNVSDMRRLVTQMGLMQNPWNCPHGRPTIRHLLSLKLLKV